MPDESRMAPDCGPLTPLRCGDTPRRPWLWLAALVVYALLLNLPFLGSGMPLEHHEALVAERTRGMMEFGHGLVPHLYSTGEPDFKKPPLPFWIQAGLGRLCGGISEFTLRLPSVLAGVGTMLLVVALVRRMAAWRPALVAGLVFTASAASMVWSRKGSVDMLLCLLTTAALVAYWYGLTEPNRRRQVILFAAMWLSLGLGVLAKGPLPLAVWLMAVVGAALADPRARRVGRMLPIAGPLILAAVVVPWGLYVLKTYPGAVEQWYSQSLGRTQGELEGRSHLYDYLYMTPALWLPWPAFVVVGLVTAVRRKTLAPGAVAFLLAWGLGLAALLTFSAEKRIYYVLATAPAMLALAGLGEDYVTFLWQGPRSRLGRWFVALHALAIPGGVLAAVALARRFPDVTAWMVPFGAVLVAGLTVTFVLFVCRRRVAAMASMATLILVAFLVVLAEPVRLVLSPTDRTSADLGRFVAAMDPPPQGVCLYKWRRNAAAVTFYVAQRVPVMEQLDAVAAWRRDHPDGCVVVRAEEAAELEPLGPWRWVFPEAPPGDGRRYCLLQAVGSR
ncbi:MAG TPA: glycosyltransferase family 39 protein [Phycisphaerae bacterium]|nr:glycosyltransferase family 39 protein [Phycisphaerae bacterium]